MTIDFAIEREQEAVDFYKSLQVNSDFQSNKNFYVELEAMEQGHINTLENLKKNVIENSDLKVPTVDNLHISDYLVDVPSEGKLSYQDILILAMKREEKAYALYAMLAEEATDTFIKNIFLKLASEEAKHKNHFEKKYDSEILTDN
jgi:hypothetical protein